MEQTFSFHFSVTWLLSVEAGLGCAEFSLGVFVGWVLFDASAPQG